MIIDLLRNDLGRVCEYGSVRVPHVCRLESYRYVHHLVSEVRGRLRPGLGPVDLLRAAFPGGSVTGAPKVRATQIIAELEPTARGAYCGSLAYVGFDGAMDSIKKSGADIQATMIATDPTANAGLSKIQAYYLGNQDVKGLFGVSGGDTMNCGLLSRQNDLASKGVHAGGYDMLPRSLEAVRDGFLDFVIDQQPYLQGFYTVMEMFAYKVSGGLIGPADIDTGLKFVTKDAVGQYMNTKSRYEGSAKDAAIIPRSGAIGG